MNQWISSVNSYYYPYMIYHVTHERLVYPQLGIASDEKVVAHALPKVERALEVPEQALGHGADYIIGSELTLADFFMLPSTYAFGLTEEGKAMYPKYPRFCEWRAHGVLAGGEALSRLPSSARSDRARPQVGCFAPPEILRVSKGHCALGAQSLHPPAAIRGDRRRG